MHLCPYLISLLPLNHLFFTKNARIYLGEAKPDFHRNSSTITLLQIFSEKKHVSTEYFLKTIKVVQTNVWVCWIISQIWQYHWVKDFFVNKKAQEVDIYSFLYWEVAYLAQFLTTVNDEQLKE